MGVRLPAEYQEVEYIQSHGTEWINTRFSPTIETEVVVDFSDFKNNGNSYATPFGLSVTGSHVGAYKQTNRNVVYTAFGSAVDVSYSTLYGWVNRLVISQSKNGVFENNTRVLSAYSKLTFTETAQNIYVFARSDNRGNAARIVILKLYGLQINDNAIQVRNYIPCYRKSDNKPGLYDLVTREFYTNDGTGEFEVGPDVIDSISPLMVAWRRAMMRRKPAWLPAEYQEVEYVQVTGTQAFFTDVPIQDGLTVDSVQTFAGGDTYLFGGNNGHVQICFNGTYNGRLQSSYDGYYYWTGGYDVQDNNTTKYHVVQTQRNGSQIGFLDDVQILNGTRSTTKDTSAGKTAALFGQRNASDVLSTFYKGKVYSCKVSKDGTLLADFVPCYRKADSKPGMYDLVRHKFYINEGTGEFTVGADVN